jgi:D-3-phosphoglycerate dehydrogenase
MSETFRVGLTRDFLKPDGKLGFGDIGLEQLEGAAGVEWEFLADGARELRPEQVRDYDALLLLGARVTAATLAGEGRLKLIARFGVGYDNVDVEACTRAGVILTITPDGVRRPVAAGALAFLLALSHKLLIKDRLTRAGRWHDRMDHMGQGLTGRVLGLIGLGNIGREILRLSRPLEMRRLGCDPHVGPEALVGLEVERVDLETLLRRSDFVIVSCSLVPETRHLLNAERLSWMKPTAYLINVARGPIVDQKALAAALREKRIQGAALDVFEEEPLPPDDPLLGLENAILAPHAICWTDECFSGNGRDACRSILDVAAGRLPRSVVNREVLESPNLRARITRQRD